MTNESNLIELAEQVTVLMEKYHRLADKSQAAQAQLSHNLQHALSAFQLQTQKTAQTHLTDLKQHNQAFANQVLSDFQSRLNDAHSAQKWASYKVLGLILVTSSVLLATSMFLIYHYTKEISRYQVGAEIQRLYAQSDVTRCGKQLCARLATDGKKGDYVQIEVQK